MTLVEEFSNRVSSLVQKSVDETVDKAVHRFDNIVSNLESQNSYSEENKKVTTDGESSENFTSQVNSLVETLSKQLRKKESATLTASRVIDDGTSKQTYDLVVNLGNKIEKANKDKEEEKKKQEKRRRDERSEDDSKLESLIKKFKRWFDSLPDRILQNTWVKRISLVVGGILAALASPAILGFLSKVFTSVSSKLIGGIKTFMQEYTPHIYQYIKSLADWVKDTWNSGVTWVTETLWPAISKLASSAEDILSDIKVIYDKTISSKPGSVKSWVKGTKEGLKASWKSLTGEKITSEESVLTQDELNKIYETYDKARADAIIRSENVARLQGYPWSRDILATGETKTWVDPITGLTLHQKPENYWSEVSTEYSGGAPVRKDLPEEHEFFGEVAKTRPSEEPIKYNFPGKVDMDSILKNQSDSDHSIVSIVENHYNLFTNNDDGRSH